MINLFLSLPRHKEMAANLRAGPFFKRV